MRWKTTATVMIIWSALAALATTFVFSCCVLPFHEQIHAALPLCHLAKAIAPDAGSETTQQDPARVERATAPAKAMPQPKFFIAAAHATEAPDREEGSAIQRAHYTHGALRCDNDVGLLPLLTLLRI